VVLRALLRDLPGLLEQVQRRPQLLFVTGDLANRGDKREYDGAFRLLDELCGLLGLSRERDVFMVPGNHDVDRSMISKSVARYAHTFDELDEDEFRTAIADLIDEPNDFANYGRRLSAWCDFTSRFLGPARQTWVDRPWRSDVVEVAGVRVGIASICSVWMSGSADGKGRLVVGERQLRMLIDELAAVGPDLRIALMHHPVAWLREAEDRHVQRLLRDEFDVVLHGHVHDPKAGTFVHGRHTTVEIGAGATYAGIGQDRFHGISVAQIDAGREQLELDAFTWTSRSGFWHIDAGFHRDAPDGRLRLPLSLPRMGQGATRAAASEELSQRLRRAVISVFGSSQGFVGFPDAAPKPKASLHDMFVRLALRRLGSSEELMIELATLRERWLRPPAEGAATTRVVVLGDPGSGKSTSCRHLAVWAAEAANGPVPVLLTVRDWASDGAWDSLLEQACRHAKSVLQVDTSTEDLARLCEAGQVVLIIDGVDEVGARGREALRDRVHGFATQYPRTPIVVTSRIIGYDEAPLDRRSFEHLALEPFDDARVREFIERWYSVAEPDNPVECRRKQAELWDALQVEPRALQLARNPLLATLLALVHFHLARLPGDRATLYKLCIETLVVTWPAACGRELAEFSGHQQLPSLEDLALWMQSQRPEDDQIDDSRAVVITRAQLQHRLFELIGSRFEELDEGRRLELTDKWRRWLIRASGLIQEQTSGHFGFLHLSLMEYLAGQAAWRTQLRDGHAAIAKFVVAQHRKPAWQETLLLMLGSHGNEREVTDAVVTALLQQNQPTWDTCLFMLGLLREELELDAGLRTRMLDTIAQVALSQWPGSWDSAKARISDILCFGQRHRESVERWMATAMARRRGEALLGALVLLPDHVDPSPELNRRTDTDIMLPPLLDLGGRRWGSWAAERAQPGTWLTWASRTPLEGIIWRSVGLGSELPAIWIGPLLRRMAWLGEVVGEGARALRSRSGGGGWGIPAAMRCSWSNEQVDVCVVPSVMCGIGEAADFALDFTYDFARAIARDFGFDSERLSSLDSVFQSGLSFTRYFSLDFALDFSRDWAADYEQYFAQEFTQDFALRFALDFSRDSFTRYFALDLALDFARDFSLSRKQHGSAPCSPARVTMGSPPVEVDRLMVAFIAELHIGLLFSLSGQPAPHIAAARVQNRWIHIYYDALVAHLAKGQPPSPEQHALLLVLGLAQYQTTWAWPPSRHWRAWFTSSPPEHPLPAYVWHLCFAAGEPDNPSHLTAAATALERVEWPELVADLRLYSMSAPSPEYMALFNDGRSHSSPES
jgi:predicted phosphodiesterase